MNLAKFLRDNTRRGLIAWTKKRRDVFEIWGTRPSLGNSPKELLFRFDCRTNGLFALRRCNLENITEEFQLEDIRELKTAIIERLRPRSHHPAE